MECGILRYSDIKFNSVQSKINCVFEVNITNEKKSSKRYGQNYQVLATKNFSEEALNSDCKTAFLSEKIDGTCCYIASYKDDSTSWSIISSYDITVPYEIMQVSYQCVSNIDRFCLWARFDRKLNKNASKRLHDFKKNSDRFNDSQQDLMPEFDFIYPDDLKVAPEAWIPAQNVNRHPKTNDVVPDANGHVPGWLPIHVDPKQYCWHHSAVSDDFGLLLILKEFEAGSSKLCLTVEPMSNYSGKTLELIGTNVNANPYGLGSKQAPFHVYVPHGGIGIRAFPVDLSFDSIKSWFVKDYNTVEGIVWRCSNGKLFKLHRHHIGLPWPLLSSKKRDEDVEGDDATHKPSLCARDVEVMSEMLQDIDDTKLSKLFLYIKKVHLKTFSSIVNLSLFHD